MFPRVNLNWFSLVFFKLRLLETKRPASHNHKIIKIPSGNMSVRGIPGDTIPAKR
jgi:hypothetical protein